MLFQLYHNYTTQVNEMFCVRRPTRLVCRNSSPLSLSNHTATLSHHDYFSISSCQFDCLFKCESVKIKWMPVEHPLMMTGSTLLLRPAMHNPLTESIDRVWQRQSMRQSVEGVWQLNLIGSTCQSSPESGAHSCHTGTTPPTHIGARSCAHK